jgi:hypothetical protein
MKNSNYLINRANHSSRRGVIARSVVIHEDCLHVGAQEEFEEIQ